MIHVAEHPEFRREGTTCTPRSRSPSRRRRWGPSRAVPTLDGEHELQVPAGTQSGTRFRLRGKGVPSLDRRGRGDHYLTVVVHTPESLDTEQRELLERLAGDRGRAWRRPRAVRSGQGHLQLRPAPASIVVRLKLAVHGAEPLAWSRGGAPSSWLPAGLEEMVVGILGAACLGVDGFACGGGEIGRHFAAASDADAARRERSPTAGAAGIRTATAASACGEARRGRTAGSSDYQASLQPQPLGRRFLVDPAGRGAAGDRIVISLVPGQAFGTGEHPTTRLCVSALEREVVDGSRWADVGCGSGILPWWRGTAARPRCSPWISIPRPCRWRARWWSGTARRTPSASPGGRRTTSRPRGVGRPRGQHRSRVLRRQRGRAGERQAQSGRPPDRLRFPRGNGTRCEARSPTPDCRRSGVRVPRAGRSASSRRRRSVMARLWRVHPRGAFPQEAGAAVELSEAETHHVLRVLRLQAGDALGVFDGAGSEWLAPTIEATDGGRVTVRLDRRLEHAVESALEIVLYPGMCRADRMEWLVQKATELGVSAVRPLADRGGGTPRVERSQADAAGDASRSRPASRADGAASRAIEPIAACRGRRPTTFWPCCWTRPPARSRCRVSARESSGRPRSVWLAVGTRGRAGGRPGPQPGWRAARLGPRTLRSETAGSGRGVDRAPPVGRSGFFG